MAYLSCHLLTQYYVRHPPSKSVYVASPSPDLKVAVLSGGGAGHEPAHASYTGDGMLTASVSGDIFASPSSKQILAAIQFAAYTGDNPEPTAEEKVKPKRDVLVIINNYTGDRLNFVCRVISCTSISSTNRTPLGFGHRESPHCSPRIAHNKRCSLR